MAAQGTQLGSQGKGCTPTPERKDAERGPGDTKFPSYHVLGAPKEANDCRVGKPWAQRGVRALRSITVTLWGQKAIMKGESRVFNKEAGVRDTRVASAVLRGRKTGRGSTVMNPSRRGSGSWPRRGPALGAWLRRHTLSYQTPGTAQRVSGGPSCTMPRWVPPGFQWEQLCRLLSAWPSGGFACLNPRKTSSCLTGCHEGPALCRCDRSSSPLPGSGTLQQARRCGLCLPGSWPQRGLTLLTGDTVAVPRLLRTWH